MKNLLDINDLKKRTDVNPIDVVKSGPSDENRNHILSLLNECSDALNRSCRPGHITGSSVVLDPSGSRVLLMFHTKLERWLQPGGHADDDGDLARVALREAIEETGIQDLLISEPPIDFDIHLVEPPDEDPHKHYDVRYLVLASAGSKIIGNHESQDLRWFKFGELDSLGIDSGLARLIKRGLNRLETLGVSDNFKNQLGLNTFPYH